MKAIIMAGGEGTRLRPVNHSCPKPMVRLLGRPLMEHIVELLKKNGITDICVTLRYMPDHITDYFGDGSSHGVRIRYEVENEPLGTAGGVRACSDFTGGEDFLVISGDAACDFDLSSLINAHGREKCAVTMALYSHPDPLQYGLVLTSPDSRVISFIEKPPWERVVTDLVNTGIYVVSARAMEHVPEKTRFDFAKDLFPLLMEKGEALLGVTMEGYWCDVGSPAAYLQCSIDALTGRLNLGGRFFRETNEVLSRNIPEGYFYQSPCFISSDATIDAGALVGPNAVIGPGSHVGSGSVVTDSVIDGGFVSAGCRIEGAVICKDALVPVYSTVSAGEVIAPAGAPSRPVARPQEEKPRRAPLMHRVEVACGNRARLMRVLSESLAEFGADFTDGLNLNTSLGGVRISPNPGVDALYIEADKQELCDEYAKLARSLEGDA